MVCPWLLLTHVNLGLRSDSTFFLTIGSFSFPFVPYSSNNESGCNFPPLAKYCIASERGSLYVLSLTSLCKSESTFLRFTTGVTFKGFVSEVCPVFCVICWTISGVTLRGSVPSPAPATGSLTAGAAGLMGSDTVGGTSFVSGLVGCGCSSGMGCNWLLFSLLLCSISVLFDCSRLFSSLLFRSISVLYIIFTV